MSKFSSQLDTAYKRKVLGTLEKAVRSTALVVDAELVRRTPVDTGRARANWLPSLNSPDVKIVAPGAKPNIENTLAGFSIKDTVLITNNLPYIRKLNDGSSLQAPKGFVQDAIQVGKNVLK